MKKRILITGGSSGIGRAAALALASPDNELVLVGRRTEELEKVAEECSQAGGFVDPFPYDLTNLERIKILATRLMAREGYPVLINAAGIGVFNNYSDLAWEDIERQYTVNLMAPAKLIHNCLPGMVDRGAGQIINVLSMTCVHVLPGGGGYSPAKSGLQMLGKVVSQEYRNQGIRLTNLMPGATATPIWEGSPMEAKMKEMIPTGEVASLIARLVESPDSYNMDEILMMPRGGVL